MKAAYTPGPWRVVGPYVSIDFAVICKYADNKPSVTWAASPASLEAASNAKLIAAAPDLYEAAKLVMSRWESGDLAAAVRALDIAISKAEGEF